MPIVNGTYVPDQMPVVGKKTYEQQTGDKWSGKDWSDTTTAQYNFLMKQQEQAYNLDLWNLMNEYNSPAAQMQRYQNAGLNPALIYGQQNIASSPAQASASQFKSQGTQARRTQNAMNMIGQMQGLMKSAVDTYEYMTHGSETSRWKMIAAQEQALGLKLQNAWDDYLLHGENMIYGDATRLVGGPRATLYGHQIATAEQNVEKLKLMISSVIPNQVKRIEALTKLDNAQYDLMQGKYSAVLDIDLGLGDQVNQWAKMILFMSMAKLF